MAYTGKLTVAAIVLLSTLHRAAAAAEAQTTVAREAEQIMQGSGVQGGLVVHVGCGDGKLTALLRAGDSYLVHGLDRDPANIDKARAHIRSLGLYGKVSVDRWTDDRLPYTDNLVNLLVAEDLGQAGTAEVMRVLSPGGVAYVRAGGKWTRTVKPRPGEIDEWTHFLHGPDNNAVAKDSVVGLPYHLQWVGGPRWTRSHDHLATISAVVSAGGRIFYIVDLAPTASVAYPAKWFIIARDAFNGVVLWQRPMGPWHDHLWGVRSGPSDLARRLVAVGNRVYVTLGYGKPVTALDAATGKTVRQYEGTAGTREIVLEGGRLFLVADDPAARAAATAARRRGRAPPPSRTRLLVLDVATGKRLWQKADADAASLQPTTLAVAGGRVLYQNAGEVICLDAASGRRQWAAPRSSKGTVDRLSAFAPTLVVCGDVVLSADHPGPNETKIDGKVIEARDAKLIAYSAKDGKILWTARCQENFCAPVDLLVAGGLLWTGELWSVISRGITVVRDAVSGEIRMRRPDDDPNSIVVSHHRCHRIRGTNRYILLSRAGVEFVNVRSGKMIMNHWVRGTCQFGVLPCNGLLYAPPHSCACYIKAKLTGFNALAPKRPAQVAWSAREEARLRQGPAFGRAAAPSRPSDADWPTYRRDAARSGSTKAGVDPNARPIWQTALGGRLTSPVVAGGTVLVASIDTHTVFALRAKDATVLWSRTVGGPVDSPPTVRAGLVLFGSADGWVYCLRASDGELVWRFQAAPEDRRLVADGQLESVWPVPGSVLVHNGAAYFAAGRASYLDGGVSLYRLDFRTGKLLRRTVIDSRDPQTGYQPGDAIRGFDMPGALPDVLSAAAGQVFMRHLAFDQRGVRQKSTRPHLFSSAGFLDDSWWHRTYWIFGTDMGSGFRDWKNAGNRFPAGRLLVFDESSVYGYGRNNYAMHGSHVGLGKTRYRLFAAGKKPPEGKRPGETTVDRQWTREVPLVVRAMVLAGRALWLAGPPDAIDPNNPAAAVAGRTRGLLWAVSAADGSKLAECRLSSPPVFDGMAAAGGRLYASLQDGSVICMGNAADKRTSHATN